jgi:hypothetical protein
MPEKTLTFTQTKLDAIIKSRVAEVRSALRPRLDLVDELQAALGASVAQVDALERQLAQLGAEPAASSPAPVEAPEPDEEPATPPRDWSAEDFTAPAADRVAARLARTT